MPGPTTGNRFLSNAKPRCRLLPARGSGKEGSFSASKSVSEPKDEDALLRAESRRQEDEEALVVRPAITASRHGKKGAGKKGGQENGERVQNKREQRTVPRVPDARRRTARPSVAPFLRVARPPRCDRDDGRRVPICRSSTARPSAADGRSPTLAGISHPSLVTRRWLFYLNVAPRLLRASFPRLPRSPPRFGPLAQP